jgi:hypothetical protein
MALHGNPADYAWGVGGLDNIITQVSYNDSGGVVKCVSE